MMIAQGYNSPYWRLAISATIIDYRSTLMREHDGRQNVDSQEHVTSSEKN